MVLEDGYRTQPVQVRVESLEGKGAWLRVVMREGRKRQIREVGARLGLPVVKIIRIRIGNLKLGNLKPRDWRHLTPQEVAGLKEKPGRASSRPKKAGSKPGKNGKSNRAKSTPEEGKHR